MVPGVSVAFGIFQAVSLALCKLARCNQQFVRNLSSVPLCGPAGRSIWIDRPDMAYSPFFCRLSIGTPRRCQVTELKFARNDRHELCRTYYNRFICRRCAGVPAAESESMALLRCLLIQPDLPTLRGLQVACRPLAETEHLVQPWRECTLQL
jgi:hypothetical protein